MERMADLGKYPFHEFLADTEWLSRRLNDSDIRIVDADVAVAYDRGHIPGAVLVPDNYFKDPSTGQVHILPSQDFAHMMECLGICDGTTVVAYDNSRSLYAGRLWWALQYYGHRNVKVLNGGWKEWVSNEKPISIERVQVPHRARFTPKVDPSLIITTDELKRVYARPEVSVWDARSRREYTGDNPRGNRRAGHIPGAVHLEWLDLMDERTHMFKPAKEMRNILGSKGITPEKEVLVHCQAGIRAAHGTVVLKVLGYNKVRNYDASWAEWGNLDDTEVEPNK